MMLMSTLFAELELDANQAEFGALRLLPTPTDRRTTTPSGRRDRRRLPRLASRASGIVVRLPSGRGLRRARPRRPRRRLGRCRAARRSRADGRRRHTATGGRRHPPRARTALVDRLRPPEPHAHHRRHHRHQRQDDDRPAAGRGVRGQRLADRGSSARSTAPAPRPEAPELQALLASFRDDGASAAVLEVSSHALALHRVDGTEFDAVVFTNLGRDHLDLHGSTEEYFRAKARLFQRRFAPLADREHR